MSRQQHTSSDERFLLISLFKERASILQSKKAEGKKALPKAKAWEDITSALNAAALGPPRSVKQTKKLWENMKSRAKKLYGIEGNRTDGSVHSQHYDVISAKVFDIISKDLNRNIKTRDVNSDPTCGTDGNGDGCSGGSQAEMCRVREECQETFMEETAEDEDTLGADDTIAFDVVNKTVGLPFPVGNDSLDLGDSRISSMPDVQNAHELPSSELENKRTSFSDSQVSPVDHLPNSPERPALCGNQTSDSDERGLAAAARLSHISEGPKLGCDISAGTTTSGAASPLRTLLKLSEEECYTASVSFQKKEHKLLMNVQKAKLQAQEAKLKHLDKQALIDAEKLKQMQMQSLLNAHLLESITQWKEIAVSIQETVDRLKNFYQVGETSAADKNSTKGTSATEKSSDGSVHLKPKENPSSVLESLYEDSAFADVTLTAQGQSVRAHRAVLSAKSLYFKEVLQSNPYQHPIIIMPLDVQFSDLQAIISYIYKGEITLPSENLQSLLKTANALQISDLTRAGVLGWTANDRDEAPCKTVELHSDRVNSRSSTYISEHNAAEGTQNQPTVPVIARKDVLHSDRAEGPFLSSRRKRPRAEAFSEAEPTTSVRTQSKSPRLAESNSCSETPDGTPMVAEVKVEGFEGHGDGLEDYTSTDYMHCDKSLLQPEQSLGRHSETADSIFIKEEPID